MSYDEIEQLHL